MATVRYTTIQGEILTEKRAGVRRLYVPDPLGSTVALLDNTQTKTDTFSYWPYGEESARTGSTPTPFRFVGTKGYYRDKIERVYVRARHLRTDQARWLTVDPIGFGGSDVNLYGYVSNSPEVYTDPSGLYQVKPGACGQSRGVTITPGPDDLRGVVVGPGGTMVHGENVLPVGADCIAVNGSYFRPNDEGKYPPGGIAKPAGDVIDCWGKKYLSPKIDWTGIHRQEIKIGRSRLEGRTNRQDSGESYVARTGACIDGAGNLVSIIVVPRITAPGFEACLKNQCGANRFVFLDGGGSSQVISRPGFGPVHRYPGFDRRAVHNWIVICNPFNLGSFLRIH